MKDTPGSKVVNNEVKSKSQLLSLLKDILTVIFASWPLSQDIFRLILNLLDDIDIRNLLRLRSVNKSLKKIIENHKPSDSAELFPEAVNALAQQGLIEKERWIEQLEKTEPDQLIETFKIRYNLDMLNFLEVLRQYPSLRISSLRYPEYISNFIVQCEKKYPDSDYCKNIRAYLNGFQSVIEQGKLTLEEAYAIYDKVYLVCKGRELKFVQPFWSQEKVASAFIYIVVKLKEHGLLFHQNQRQDGIFEYLFLSCLSRERYSYCLKFCDTIVEKKKKNPKFDWLFLMTQFDVRLMHKKYEVKVRIERGSLVGSLKGYPQLTLDYFAAMTELVGFMFENGMLNPPYESPWHIFTADPNRISFIDSIDHFLANSLVFPGLAIGSNWDHYFPQSLKDRVSRVKQLFEILIQIKAMKIDAEEIVLLLRNLFCDIDRKCCKTGGSKTGGSVDQWGFLYPALKDFLKLREVFGRSFSTYFHKSLQFLVESESQDRVICFCDFIRVMMIFQLHKNQLSEYSSFSEIFNVYESVKLRKKSPVYPLKSYFEVLVIMFNFNKLDTFVDILAKNNLDLISVKTNIICSTELGDFYQEIFIQILGIKNINGEILDIVLNMLLEEIDKDVKSLEISVQLASGFNALQNNSENGYYSVSPAILRQFYGANGSRKMVSLITGAIVVGRIVGVDNVPKLYDNLAKAALTFQSYNPLWDLWDAVENSIKKAKTSKMQFSKSYRVSLVQLMLKLALGEYNLHGTLPSPVSANDKLSGAVNLIVTFNKQLDWFYNTPVPSPRDEKIDEVFARLIGLSDVKNNAEWLLPFAQALLRLRREGLLKGFLQTRTAQKIAEDFICISTKDDLTNWASHYCALVYGQNQLNSRGIIVLITDFDEHWLHWQPAPIYQFAILVFDLINASGFKLGQLQVNQFIAYAKNNLMVATAWLKNIDRFSNGELLFDSFFKVLETEGDEAAATFCRIINESRDCKGASQRLEKTARKDGIKVALEEYEKMLSSAKAFVTQDAAGAESDAASFNRRF